MKRVTFVPPSDEAPRIGGRMALIVKPGKVPGTSKNGAKPKEPVHGT